MSNIYALDIFVHVSVCVFEIVRKMEITFDNKESFAVSLAPAICYVTLPPTFILDSIKINIYYIF